MIEWDPVDRLDVVNVALPPLNVAVPIRTAPSKNCTVPVAAAGETVAVNVTARPAFDGLRLDFTVVVVFAWFTVCDAGADELALCVASPLYSAVIECTPTARLDVDIVPRPFESSGDEPRIVAPSLKVTVPVGVPAPLAALTVASSTTDWPNVDGFGVETTTVVVAGDVDTTWVRTDDVLPPWLASPLYTAVIEWLPTESVDVDNDAVPALSVTVPMGLAPSRNCTVPVAPAGDTVAVNVTLSPKVEGFRDDESAVVVATTTPFTTCVTTDEVLPAWLASPLYTALIWWFPTDSVDVDNDAVAPLRLTVPSGLAPSKNCTVPVDPAGDTVAVNATLSPDVEGFRDDETAVVVGTSELPHDGNWKEMMRVLQSASCVVA